MQKEELEKINKLLWNNKSKDFLLIGENFEIENAVYISAKIQSKDLAIGIDNNSKYIYPQWVKDLEKIDAEKKHLIITDLDTISLDEQEKFIGLLKYKNLNGYSLPENTQIIMLAQNQEKVSLKITTYLLIYKIKNN